MEAPTKDDKSGLLGSKLPQIEEHRRKTSEPRNLVVEGEQLPQFKGTQISMPRFS
jgi:hypothetical protein